jgi:hypothetical protein
MAASEEGCTYDFDVPWPLHLALVTLSEASTKASVAPWSFAVDVVDHAGTGVPAADAAVLDLCRRGFLLSDPQRSRRLCFADSCRPAARRALFTLDPHAAALVYRAARFWATASSTVSKNFDTAAWSLAATS